MEFGAEIRLGSGNAAQIVDGVVVVNRPLPRQSYQLTMSAAGGELVRCESDSIPELDKMRRQFEALGYNVGMLAPAGTELPAWLDYIASRTEFAA